MIIDQIENAQAYFALHPAFERAFAFLRRPDLAGLEDGAHEIDSKQLYALMQVPDARKRGDAELEAHRLYIDIQYLIDGDEEIGWRPVRGCSELSLAYDKDKDIEFYSDSPLFYLHLEPRMFALFFPSDAHAPMISAGRLHKCVVKVRV